MNLSNAISNVKFAIDSDKLHERTDGWSTVVAPSKYYDGEATVKCTWTEKDQHTPYPYTTYYRSYTWKIRCNDNPIVLYTTELRLKPGEYGNIRVDCTYSNISYYYNCSYEWHFSTKNSSIAKVQQTGLVEAVGPGQTEIVISSPNAKDDKYCKVIVEYSPTHKLTLTASPSGGEVPANTIVTLTAKSDGSTVTGCDIYYTINGSTPNKYSTKYTSSGITISNDCTLKAIAYKDGYEDSDELMLTYKIKQLNDGDVFTFKTAGDIDMTFEVISAAEKTCKVGYPAIDRGTKGHVEIPEIVNGFRVVSVGNSAFLGCEGITSVSIPQTVTEFGEDSFNQCLNLESINIPEHLQVIGERTFYHNKKLSCPVVIPEGVTVLEKRTFEYCNSLTSITLPSTLTEIKDAVFSECRALESIKIPNGVNSIGKYAFDGCGLISLDWPDKVTEIPEACFRSCSNLVSIHIPQTVKSIGKEAFSNSGLQSLDDIPSSVTEIGESAFYQADLTNVTIPSGITTISKNAFHNCTKLTSVTISPSVTTICEEAFSWCQSIKEVIIPSSVKRIEEKAFFVLTNLKHIYSFIQDPFVINENVFYASEYENRMFRNYDNVTLYVPDGTKSKYESTAGWNNFKNIVELICVTSITLDKTSLSLQIGEEETLKATVKPDNATDKSVTWSSSNTSVATVDNNGKVTAVAAGCATITCTANDGSGVETFCRLTVTLNADVNGDGVVDVADIASVISVMAGQGGNTTEKSADVNNDGTVDVADIAAVITRMAELARQQHTIAEEE